MSRSIKVVLLVDTVKSTELLTRLGQDRMDALAALEMAELRSAVEDGGGTVLRSTGDGLLATFHTASSALDAASAMHRRVARLNDGDRLHVDLRVRVTLAASDVTSAGDEISGVATVLTARLEQHARAGETVCTDVVRLLSQGWGDHEFERMEPLQLDGLPEPVIAHRVRASIADRLGMPDTLDATRRFAFVGRAREWDVLRASWHEATKHAGSLIVLAGDPGVGKTRLCREFASAVRNEGAIVLHGSCTELAGWAFEPFVDSLRHCLARIADAGEVLGPQPAPLAALVPEILTRVPGLEPLEAVDPEAERTRLFNAVTAWLVHLSLRAPLLCVVDDLSWADEATVAMLRHLAAKTGTERILLIASYRPADALPHVRTFLQEHRASAQRVEVGGLSAEHALVFTEHVLGGHLDADARHLVTATSRRVGGNPLYLGELTPHLVETGALVARPGDVWTRGAPLRNGNLVPPSVGDIIVRRIDHLGAAAYRTLRIASVVGTWFVPALLVELLDSTSEECATALEEVVAAGFLQQVIGADGVERVDFSHAIFRDVVYSRLSTMRRMAEHRRVGETIERVYAHDLAPWREVLAFQFEQCVDLVGPDRAIDALREAGKQAELVLGHDHAAGFYRRALALTTDDTTEGRTIKCRLLVLLGIAERRAGSRAARQTLHDATELAMALGDARLATQAVLGAGRGVFSRAGMVDEVRVEDLRSVLQLIGPARTELRARLLAALSAELIFADEPTAAQNASDEALSIAHELASPATLVTTLGYRLVALWRPDCVDERLALGAQLDAIRKQAGRRSGQFLSAVTLYYQAAMEHGDIELADELLAWIEETAERLQQPATNGYAKLRVASRACLAGRLTTAERLATEVYHVCREAGQIDAEAFYTGQLFTIRLHQGRLDEVVDMVERCAVEFPGIRAFRAAVAVCGTESGDLPAARRSLDEIGSQLDAIRFDLNWLSAIALMTIAAGPLDDVRLAARLRPLLEPYRHLFVDNATTFFGSVHHYFAACSALVGDEEVADREFEAAIAAHQRIGSPPLVARSRIEFAEAIHRRSNGTDARAEALARAAFDDADHLGYRTIAVRCVRLLTGSRDPVA